MKTCNAKKHVNCVTNPRTYQQHPLDSLFQAHFDCAPNVRHVEKQLHGALERTGFFHNDHPRPRLKSFKTDIKTKGRCNADVAFVAILDFFLFCKFNCPKMKRSCRGWIHTVRAYLLIFHGSVYHFVVAVCFPGLAQLYSCIDIERRRKTICPTTWCFCRIDHNSIFFGRPLQDIRMHCFLHVSQRLAVATFFVHKFSRTLPHDELIIFDQNCTFTLSRRCGTVVA